MHRQLRPAVEVKVRRSASTTSQFLHHLYMPMPDRGHRSYDYTYDYCERHPMNYTLLCTYSMYLCHIRPTHCCVIDNLMIVLMSYLGLCFDTIVLGSICAYVLSPKKKHIWGFSPGKAIGQTTTAISLKCLLEHGIKSSYN